ncbi:MAG: hypothetical protein AABM43_04515 [Actinomycetota bacterium]
MAATVALAASLATVPAASASRSETTLFDLGGAALDVSAEGRAKQLDELQDLGVDTVRVIVAWRQIAPEPNSPTKPTFDATDPAAYPQQWDALDDLVRGARSRGLSVLLTPGTPVPDWASSAHEQFTDPNPSDFQQFVQALGTRYSGNYSPPPILPTDPPNPVLPRVDHWSVLNEANLTLFLKPQLRHGKSVSGRIYRELFLAAQRGLQASGHTNDTLLIGEASPGPGRKGTDPITFLRGVFCLNAKFKRKGGCAPINADGWAQHPYDPFDAPFESSHNLINLDTIDELATALKKARAAGATTRKLPIYVTEYGIESVPDRRYGVSQLQQAEYIAISEYLMYRNPTIRSFGQYLMQDDVGNAQVNFQTGLRFSDGRKKISYDAFPIALVAQRPSEKRNKVTIWGHVRPKGGPFTVTVKARGPGAAHRLKTIHTSANGYFQFRTTFHQGRRYSASTRLPDGTELTGPFVRVYVFK